MQPTSASEQNLSSISWPTMSIERYAALEQSLGANVLQLGDTWWVQIRPWFYRPLLPFKKYDADQVRQATLHRRTVFQHAVMDGQPHNSYLNPIIFDDLHSYDPRTLHKKVRWDIRKALKNNVTVSRIVDETEFVESGYRVYVSFYERTKYNFDTSRRQKDGFSRWAHRLFQFHEAVVVGAFAGQELVSFEISCLVENTLIQKTTVHSEKALRLSAPDLLLHHTRSSVLEQSAIHRISEGMLARNQGINEYKISRGAKALALPAVLHIRPVILWLIRKASRSIYSRLHGLDSDALFAMNLSPQSSGSSPIAE